ncbi:patatin-like phospholipase family protein [Lachnospiraceae bacterium ZAX-1]
MKRAIALCGGGTKGIYELGVWKALLELGIDYQIVTGTSIGAINGALMATREYELAVELWNAIRMEDVIVDGVNLTTTIEGMYNQREAIRPFLKKYVKKKGADISPFLEFIERQIDEEKLRKSDIDYGLVTVLFSSLKALELTKEQIPDGKLKDYIMASSSIFPLFPMHKMNGELYLDGCYHDNLPIDLALKMGADEVIAVDLHTFPIHPNYVNKPYITYIKPSRSLGTILNFDRTILDGNARLGYYDAMKTFGKLTGFSYWFYKDSLALFQDKIVEFVTKAARTESYLAKGTFNKIVKPGDGKRLCSTIEEFIVNGKRNYTREEYFLSAAEICGTIFQIEQKKLWRMEQYIENLKTCIQIEEAYPDIVIFNRKKTVEFASKLAELKIRRDSAYITGCIFYAYRKRKIDHAEQLGLLAFLPLELVAALFLLTVS